jgi:predicted metal-dependent phosphoesterase TrpH
MWLKADLHIHTCEGPEDIVRWTPREVIDLAAQAGYHILSFTDHDRRTYDSSLAAYAQERGIVLIPGVEATIERRHVLLYNFSRSLDRLRTLSDIRRRKGPDTLVIAPHPFFPGPTSLRQRLVENLDLFDAVEYCHFHTAWLDYNRAARRLAQTNDLPLVGTSDAHLPCQFGTTYSLIEAEPTLEGVLSAIRAGQVRVVSRPLKASELFAVGLVLTAGSIVGPESWPVRALEEGLGVRAIGASADAVAFPLAEILQS